MPVGDSEGGRFRGDRMEIAAAACEMMRDQAGREYPSECCGVLLGTTTYTKGRRSTSVIVAVATENVEPEDRQRRFTIAPEQLLAVHKRATRAGIEIVGYYHSHPTGAAVPSDTDLSAAWPGVSYLILEMEAETATRFRSWRRAEDGSRFCEESVHVSGESWSAERSTTVESLD